MTRFWIGIGLLLILLAAGVWLWAGLAPFHEELADDLDRAAELSIAGSWEDAQAIARSASKAWQQRQKLTAAFVDHEPLERAQALFSEMAQLQPEQYREFAAVCVHLAQTCRSISEPLKLSWWSLL